MADKVYCRDCKHFVSGVSDAAYHHCALPGPILVSGNYYAPGYWRDKTPEEQNADNDCQRFEEK